MFTTHRPQLRRAQGALVALAALLLVALVPAPAHAAQHQNAYYYSHWTPTSSVGLWNVDQQVIVEQKGRSTYWALNWRWKGASNGGYTGLQTNGNRFDGSSGDTAIFSLWNANAASGANCGAFSGEGSGLSCRLPYTITANRTYRLRVWRLQADAGGQWWGAWVQDTVTGKDTQLGALRVAPSATGIGNVENFVEYFGSAVACNAVPTSRVLWTQPAGNSRGAGTYEVGTNYYATASDRGACSRGSATPVSLGWTKGVRVAFGG